MNAKPELTVVSSSETAQVPRVALAIDAGFGVMKLTRKARSDAEKKLAVNGVICDSFLSVALDADEKQLDVDGASKRDTVIVEYEGRNYEVGKDVSYGMVANEMARDMTDTYYSSPVYHALMRGALRYTGESTINTLVLGLPMNHYINKKLVSDLEAAYTGTITLNAEHSVTIEKTVVHPQPMGGYISLGADIAGINKALEKYPSCGIPPLKDVRDLKELRVLIVDPGEFTLDWLMMTPSGAVQRVSNAVSDAGRHRVLREVRRALADKVGRPIGASFHADIDASLRTGKPLRLAGTSFDLSAPEFKEVIAKAVEDPVRQLLEGLRGADDRIDLVAVMGGSPGAVAQAIRDARPMLPLYCADERPGQGSSLFANLRGFQEYAEIIDQRTSTV